MYTEEDLRATLGALEEEAPDPVGVLARLDQRRKHRVVRRRVVGMVAAAAVAVVVAGGSIMVGGLVGSSNQTASTGEADPHFERLRFPFAVDEVPGYQVAYRFVSFNGHSTAWIGPTSAFAAGDMDQYTLEVFSKGSYDPTPDQTGEPVQVNGKSGYYRTGMQCQCSSSVGIPGVAWEYASDSWAMVQYTRAAVTSETTPPPDVREVVLRIAGAVRFDQHAPLRLPFRVGYLPAGLQPMEDNTGDMYAIGPAGRAASVNLVGDARTLTIHALDFLSDASPGTVTVGERPVDNRLTVTVDLGDVDVQLSGEGFSVDEVKKIAESITPAADLSDTATWFDADKAIPLH